MAQKEDSLREVLQDLLELQDLPGWKRFSEAVEDQFLRVQKELLAADDPHSLSRSQGELRAWERLKNLHQELVEDVTRALNRVKENE
jgi:hypothetical protein